MSWGFVPKIRLPKWTWLVLDVALLDGLPNVNRSLDHPLES